MISKKIPFARDLISKMLTTLRKQPPAPVRALLGTDLSAATHGRMRGAARYLRNNPDVTVATALTGMIPGPGTGLIGLVGYGGGKKLMQAANRIVNPPQTPLMQLVRKTHNPLIEKMSSIKLAKVGIDFYTPKGEKRASAVVEVADTLPARAMGLMFRPEVPAGTGMFFDKVGSYWMKNVEVPLDIVFVNEKGAILEKQAMGLTGDSMTYNPTVPGAAHAIELPAGWFDQAGLQVGGTVKAVAP
jgi:uncharacterized membrane protein (UPF0127 family)